MKRFCALAFVFAFMCADASAQAVATQKQTRPATTNLTVEIRYRKDYTTFIPGDRSMWFVRFERLAGWRQPAGALPVRAVEVASRVESETALKIEVSVHLGERYHDEVKQVAAYSVRVDERVAVEELKEYGIVPVELRVVRTKPTAEAAPPYVESRTSALELVGVEAREASLPSYVVRLRNVSGKDIAALHVDYYTGKQPSTNRPQHPQNLPLIKAGEVFELNASGGDGGELTADGYTPRALRKVVIATVVFMDGTFEGEPLAAAEHHALRHGRKLQITRALTLLRNALKAPDASEPSAVAHFKSQVAALGEEIEPQVVEQLAAKFPSLGERDRETLGESIRFHLHEVKIDLLRAVAKFEEAHAQSPEKITFRRWMESVQETYGQWLARL
ncbi:MAG TPA: hypothetical protein VJ842_01845 [Pyrinomonadaceae bacterium]|nr:hypothetical protein [Pyrinomonadaceae bacterium]